MNSSPKDILLGVFHIESTPRGVHHPVNSYFVQTPHGAVLIDPGADVTPGVLPCAPTAILVTHVQDEHIAGAANFPGVPLYVPAGDEYLCAGRDAYLETDITWQPPWNWETRGNYEGHLAGARNERAPQTPLPVEGVLRDGDAICGVQVVASPGHGKNALTFLVAIEGHRVAFCGDLIYGEGQLWNWFDCDWDYGLQVGQHTLLLSARRLLESEIEVLCPAHGPMISAPRRALSLLCERLEGVLEVPPAFDAPLNFPEQDSPARGWRELSPHLHQWRAGNCAAIISETGNALLIDDGLCHWEPVETRAAFHRAVIEDLKKSLDIKRIEAVAITHFHGDHTEYIPDLVALENSEVLSLDLVADPVEHPERFNLSAPLPWYGAAHEVVKIDRRLRDGERMRRHEYELEWFHLGGQTFYHAGLTAQIDGCRVLFCGDALFGWNEGCEPVLCWNDAEPRTRGWAYAVDRMIERAPELIVCGHGSAIRDPMPLLEARRRNWQKRLEEYSVLNARGDELLFFSPFAS